MTLLAEVLDRGNQETLCGLAPSPHTSPLTSHSPGTFLSSEPMVHSLTSRPSYVLPGTLLLSMPFFLPYSYWASGLGLDTLSSRKASLVP